MDVTCYTHQSGKLPKGFDGFRAVQVSDLHDSVFGEGQSKLLFETQKLCPDIIVITGDLIDRNRTSNIKTSMEYVLGAVNIAPVYYVPGNHEKRWGRYAELRGRLLDAGATLLENKKLSLSRGGGSVTIAGMMDPYFFEPENEEDKDGYTARFAKGLRELLPPEEDDSFRLLLSHRPELFPIYAKCRIDFTFTGHAHGGQFRLPLIGPLYSPAQGVFPKYTSGIYHRGASAMAVSRGLGNSVFPIRIGNPFELVCVTFQNGQ